MKGDKKVMKAILIGKSKSIKEGISKAKQTPYTCCDVVLSYETPFIDGMMAASFKVFSPDKQWFDSLEIGAEYEMVFDMNRNLTNLLPL